MPRIRVEDYEDFEDDLELNIEEDEPTDRAGRRVQPKHPPKQDRDWEENRKRMQQKRRNLRDD